MGREQKVEEIAREAEEAEEARWPEDAEEAEEGGGEVQVKFKEVERDVRYEKG